MKNPPTKADLAKLPALDSNQNIPELERMIHMHLYRPFHETHWYVAEFCPERQVIAGFFIDPLSTECFSWSHNNYDWIEKDTGHLESERDTKWEPRKGYEVKEIWENHYWWNRFGKR